MKKTKSQLVDYILNEIPELAAFYANYKEEWEVEPLNEYSVIAHIVRPHIESLNQRSLRDKLQKVWDMLEYLAAEWGDPVRNEIFVVATEDIETHKYYEFFGPILKQHCLLSVSWFPEYDDQMKEINRHFDKREYERRLVEEIEKDGGFARLTNAREAKILKKLSKEFGVREYPTI